MRITYLTAGAAGMYCGACARDAVLIRGLLARGHEVQVIPLYTPLKLEGAVPLPTTRVMLGGVNMYLQQKCAACGMAPAALRGVLDRPGLLNFATRFAVSNKAADLGPMTVSVLAGAHGRQRAELQRLMAFLEQGPRPDLVVVTNTMLGAIATEVKARLGVPVVAGLQGEEDFVGQMNEPHRSQAQALMQEHARAVDLFIAPYTAHAAKMAEYLLVPAERIRVIRTALDAAPFRRPAPRPREPFTLGYLSGIAPGKGVDLAVEALQRLVVQGRDARLRIAGKVLDKPFWRQVQQGIKAAGVAARVKYLGEITLEEKIAFLHTLSAFALPSRFAEARGLSVMEALAAGVPVVVPTSGVFPEMLELTGGGLLVEPENAVALAEAIARLMDEPEEANQMGTAGAEGIARHYGVEEIVGQTVGVYEEALGRAR
jgi:glycosyltransferase involved in cell wall biosynthesis